MNNTIDKATPQQLFRIEDRSTFIYLEHCTIARDDGALSITDKKGTRNLPIATLGTIMLGPGTSVTHQAVTIVNESGCNLVWVGEEGVRFYGAGLPLNKGDKLLRKQAQLVSHSASRLTVARKMYSLRFPDENVDTLTLKQLRGKEGTRVKKIYQELSRTYTVPWKRRNYNIEDYDDSDPINKALSAANTCLYGIVHAAVFSLGTSPGLGFVHQGQHHSFVLDVADIFKKDTSCEVSFRIMGELYEKREAYTADISTIVRQQMRDHFREHKTMQRVVKTILFLLEADIEDQKAEDFELWDNRSSAQKYGINYGKI